MHPGMTLRLFHEVYNIQSFHLNSATHMLHSITFPVDLFKETFLIFFQYKMRKTLANFAEKIIVFPPKPQLDSQWVT